MSGVVTDQMFWLGLLLKIAMTASIVVAASVVVERSGPFVGSLIAALPTAGGAAMIILAAEHTPQFIAQSVVGGMMANAAGALFALTFAVLAQRNSLPISLGGAFAVWLSGVFLSRLFEWTAPTALLANAIVYPLTIYAASHFLGDVKARARVSLTARDLVWRAGVVTLCVVIVTALSSSIGSYFSGAFAFFPVAMGSFFIILHTRAGGPVAASVAAHVQAPLIGLCLGLFAVHILAEPLGVWWSYLIGLSIGVAWNGLLWLWKSRRK
ncbi:MAG: hypothetical protein WC670_01810 [Pseudolabrys sp.]|jgi:uncharacterized membrane protein (GlpM family)